MKKSEVVQSLFQSSMTEAPHKEKGGAFAPTNIALCKYWGKRNEELNLPMTSSLSVSLPTKGATTHLTLLHDKSHDVIKLNGDDIPLDKPFAKRVTEFLDLFRPKNNWHVLIDITMNIPVAAGLASSASGFASIVSALNDLFDWNLSKRNLSILARLGSGSAARSLWNGFVEWNAGVQPDGMDSYAEPLIVDWPNLCIGLVVVNEGHKAISSREAMQRTVDSSMLYCNWPKKVATDMVILKQSLKVKNFSLLGGVAESNALAMHATMLSSWPPVCYYLPETIEAMQKIWRVRQEGLELYFTQDAGPNLKLMFLEKDAPSVQQHFPQVEVIKPF